MRHAAGIEPRQGGLEAGFRIQQKLTGGNHRLTLPQALSDFDVAARARPPTTSTGRKRPSASRTMTTLRFPVAITASCGTTMASGSRPATSVTLTSMPGFNRPPGLASSTRARSVRLVALTCGSSADTRPRNTCSGYAGTRISALAPIATAVAAASGISA